MHAFREAHRNRDSAKPFDLRDQSGERIIAGRRSLPRGGISESALRQEISEDLAALLNTVNLAAADDIAAFPDAERSIINYGLSDLTAMSIDESAIDRFDVKLADILRAYEPRLAPDSIRIERDDSVDRASLRIRFNIHAEMLSHPVDIPVEFVADIEVDSGKLRISRL
jgi:type VI secretion system protein ImpF